MCIVLHLWQFVVFIWFFSFQLSIQVLLTQSSKYLSTSSSLKFSGMGTSGGPKLVKKAQMYVMCLTWIWSDAIFHSVSTSPDDNCFLPSRNGGILRFIPSSFNVSFILWTQSSYHYSLYLWLYYRRVANTVMLEVTNSLFNNLDPSRSFAHYERGPCFMGEPKCFLTKYSNTFTAFIGEKGKS